MTTRTLQFRTDRPSPNALRRTAFGLLGASARDRKQRLIELEEEQSLFQEPALCAKARQDLANPRNRLSSELEWLPGLSPKRTSEYVALLDDDLERYFKLSSSESGLAKANLVAAGIEALSEDTSEHEWSEKILALANAVADADPAILMGLLNEDRALADCPPIQSVEAVESDLVARVRDFRDGIRSALDRMETAQMLRVVSSVVDQATDSGETRAPELVDELIDAYGLDARAFLEKEAENVYKLVAAAKAAGENAYQLSALLTTLEKVVANWSQVAQPIQTSMKARGLVHDLSSSVGYSIRGLVLSLVRDHGALSAAQRVTFLLKDRFSQFPELAELVENDVGVLDDLARQRLSAEKLNPIRAMCKAAVDAAESDPSSADSQGRKIISTAPGMLNVLEREGVDADIIRGVKDEVAHAICSCVIDYGNKTAKWHACLTLLEAANIFANGKDALERIRKNLEVVQRNVRIYGDLEPIDKAPSLHTINGIGVTLYGHTDADAESGSYMATYYFVILFIPLFPICRYRVISTGGSSYRFLGKGKLRTFDKWHIAISIGLILWMFLQK